MSAVIYQFPAGGRAVLSNRRDQTKPNLNAGNAPANTVCGSAWYHEEAIKQDEPTRTH